MQTTSNVTTVYEHGPSEHLNFLKSYRAMFSLFETLAMFKHELLLIIDRKYGKAKKVHWLIKEKAGSNDLLIFLQKHMEIVYKRQNRVWKMSLKVNICYDQFYSQT